MHFLYLSCNFKFFNNMNLPSFTKKAVFLFILTILTAHTYVFAQHTTESEKTSILDKIRFGGSLGAGFGNNNFSAFLAPKAIYDFNQTTSAGAGIAASYSKTRNFSAHSFSGSIIGLLRPFQSIQLSAELEENLVSRSWKFNGENYKDSYWYPALFLGAGYTTGAVTAGLRYDLLYEKQKSIYGSALLPFISIYF